jgi:hypothetical protein
MRHVVSLIFLMVSLMAALPALGADPRTEAEVRRVQAVLQRVHQEQQSVYQQFQMIQELRRLAIEELNPPVVYNPPYYDEAPSYEEEQRKREERLARVQGYTEELDALYERYRELEERKRDLLDQLQQLSG